MSLTRVTRPNNNNNNDDDDDDDDNNNNNVVNVIHINIIITGNTTMLTL